MSIISWYLSVVLCIFWHDTTERDYERPLIDVWQNAEQLEVSDWIFIYKHLPLRNPVSLKAEKLFLDEID